MLLTQEHRNAKKDEKEGKLWRKGDRVNFVTIFAPFQESAFSIQAF